MPSEIAGPAPSAEVLNFSTSPEDLRAAKETLLRGAEADLERLLEEGTPRTVEGLLAPLDRVLRTVQNAGLYGSIVFNTHPKEAHRAAGRELSEATDRFFNVFRANERAFRAISSVPLDPESESTRFSVQKMLRDMRRAGVQKEPTARRRMTELNNEIDTISNEFAAQIATGDRTIEVENVGQLQGLPKDYVAAHAPDASGRIQITTTYPDSQPVLAYCDDADVRRRMLSAFMNRAYPENVPVLEKLLRRRFEFATLAGYPNYAAYALEDKMIGNPEAARTFLERVAATVRSPAKEDLRRFLERKRREHPEATQLDPWDASTLSAGYYDGKLRAEQFGVDAKKLRAYLPYGRVREGLFELCRELFGLTFAPAPSVTPWHPSVEVFDVAHDGRPLGRIFLDMVPREGKFSHAACFGLRVGQAGHELPQSVLVCNFIDPNDPPETARMDYNQVVTYFHEFGHLLHALFSGHGRWLYNGMSYIEWDFVEAPSQLFEEWARDPATLSRFARNPDNGEGIPREWLEKLNAADGLGRASRWIRQVALSAISLEFYDRDPAGMSPPETLRSCWNRYYPIPIDPEYHLEASFGHLTGYSAFYYTYVWSLVIARDLLRPFHEKGTLTDPTLARRYVTEILAPGSTRPAAELVRSFLGREFEFAAFERWIQDGVRASAPPDG